MKKTSNYQILEKIAETRSSKVYRARKEGERETVIIKELRTKYPSVTDIARFNQENDIIRTIELDGIIKVLDLVITDGVFDLILEDFDGISIKELIRNEDLSIKSFLEIAIQIADTLGKLHVGNIIHKGVKPATILVNTKTGEVKITDFGISRVLTREDEDIYNPEVMEGTLLYMSPEQTGRMNRSVDYRTDLYSLGVTFYEMLTGGLPFKFGDPMEIMHSHIAIMPPLPHELKSDIPEMISTIIMKLLLKTPEERYQSGFGLKYDLEECRKQLEEHASIKPFKSGTRDIPNRFIIPQKLVGRENEIDILLSGFESTARGVSTFLIVKGAPGIGKSALINEVHKPIVARQGYYISGKNEQFTRDRPYSSIIQAFQSLIKQLLMENDERIKRWRDDILLAVGRNGSIITEIIPSLELIIGKQQDVEELTPKESRNRFNLTFENFIKVFLKKEHPVALFLDDIQWSDLASLELLKRLATSAEIKYLYLVCSYRDNEVDENHPVVLTIKEIENTGVIIQNIFLGPLNEEDIKALILNFIPCTEDVASILAGVVFFKTGGNPFFINQFLQTIYNEKFITIDPSIGWSLDLENIREMKVTDNIVQLMVERVSSLPKDALDVLKVCAAIGNRFDLDMPAWLMEITIEKVLEGLIIAIGDGYVNYNQNEGLYAFHHDRIQEAVYSIITDDEKPALHYKIGKLTMDNVPASKHQDRLFYITDHINLGAKVVAEKNENIEIARLNLETGTKAMLSAAYSPAMRYLDAGISFLGEDAWENEYELILSLYTQGVAVSCLTGDYERMESLSDIALGKAKSLLDKVTINSVKITAAVARENLGPALNAGIQVNQMLGLPQQITKSDIVKQFIKLKLALFYKTDRRILNMPDMTDPVKRAILEYGIVLGHVIFNLAPDIFKFNVLRSVYDSLRYGYGPGNTSSFAAYASILIADFNEINGGYRFGNLALKLAERDVSRRYRSMTYFVYNSLVRPWKEPIRNSLEPFMEGYKLGLETGDLFYAAFNLNFYDSYSVAAGCELPVLLKNVETHRNAIINLNQMHVLNLQNILWQFILNLTGQSDDPVTFKGKAMDEDVMIPQWEAANNKSVLATFFTFKIALCTIHHDYSRALTCVEEFEKYQESVAGTVAICDVAFYGSIAKLALYPDVSNAKKKEYLKWINKYRKLLKKWSTHSPENNLHRYHLIEAEKARVFGKNGSAQKQYDLAIALSGEYQLLHIETFANELAARYCLGVGKKKLASVYLKDAYNGCTRYGISSKLKQLKEKYPGLISFAMDAHVSTSEALDISSVLKASQAISGEIVLGKLLGKMMKIVMENAGADKVFIVFQHGNTLSVEAEGSADITEISGTKSIQVDSHDGLSRAIVHYVARKMEVLILNDASQKGAFINDPYVIKNKPKSILCTPIINQGRLTGILYLENRIAVGAFTSQRIDLLNMLSSQMAISIDNAKLYENLEDKVKERTLALGLSEDKYHTIVDNITDGYYEVDLTGAYVFYNKALCEMFGYSEEDMMSINYESFTTEETAKRVFNTYKMVYETGKSGELLDWEIITKSGLKKYISTSISSIKDNNGEITGFRGIARDITIRKKAEKALKELDRQKSTFLANISHEIRTPLTLILSPIESVIQGDFEKKIDDNFFPNLHRNAVRLLRLVNNLLDFSKIEAGKMTLKISEVDIVKILKTYTGIVLSAAHSRGITFNFISTRDTIPVFMDVEKADKLVANLFSNAIKFTEQGGRVELRIKEDEKYCYIEFEDTGIGIPQDKIGLIFDRFSQVDSSPEKKYGGTGIGLALVKEIIERHDGTISVTSKYIADHPEDHGTLFKIAIPKGAEHLKGREDVEFVDSSELAESFSDVGRYKSEGIREMQGFIDVQKTRVKSKVVYVDNSKHNILIVEDNGEMRNFIEFLLKDDYNIYTALNGKDGLEKTRSLKPDLVVTDVMMPIMNGYEMTKKIKADEELKRVPVIMLTAKAEIAKKVEGLEHGADDYLVKPFNSRELIARVRSQLRMKCMQDELIDLNKNLENRINIAVYDIIQREHESLDVIGDAAEYRDPETGGHILRVANYARLLSEALGMDEVTQELLYCAAPLHDIGKLGIPDSILLKKGKLTKDEFETMKKHCRIGYEILKNKKSKYLQAGATISLSHHEKFDGCGYPYGLSGDDIHPYGKLLAVIDVFDAISSKRVYKEAWPFDQSRDYILGERGKHFDPVIVDSFADTIEKIEEIYLMYQEK